MRSARLSYHRPAEMLFHYRRMGAEWYPRSAGQTIGGPLIWPSQFVIASFEQRPRWCVLELHFDGIDLCFQTPQDLDNFMKVMSSNPLPSGPSLVPGHRIGRPNRHWLSRLPSRAKPWKFRQRLCRHLEALPEAAEFRRFYRDQPVRFCNPGDRDDRSDNSQDRG